MTSLQVYKPKESKGLRRQNPSPKNYYASRIEGAIPSSFNIFLSKK